MLLGIYTLILPVKCYEGDFVDGKRNGKGIEYDENGNKRYEGDFVDGKLNGKGMSYYCVMTNKGDWQDGKFVEGIEYDNNGVKVSEGIKRSSEDN